MPRIKDIPGPYRFFFYSFDCNEPIHVHVRREHRTCKFWLEPIQLAANHGFTARELNAIRRMIGLHCDTITEAWHEHCG
ncbi:MAG: DUF4160 domain-containing protein [Deltaproteobacteria bacterium]|nr:MAG: DUF4160 domain-containing protein [Deltaproteobacteria bacterium]